MTITKLKYQTINRKTIIYYSIFRVEEYDETCEEFSKIEKLVSLDYSTFKIVLFVFLNLLTVGLINLFLLWYPTSKLIFLYSNVPLSKAKFVGIYGNGKFVF